MTDLHDDSDSAAPSSAEDATPARVPATPGAYVPTDDQPTDAHGRTGGRGKELIVARDVKKDFLHEGNVVEVLKGVNLTIHAGEMVCVVGASGAGKSTLLHLLGTLDLPTSGAILCEGRDVTRLSSAELASFRNSRIGFVFQFHHLLPEFTAIENVMMPGLIRGQRRGPLEAKARELLTEVGLSHRLEHRPGELSGGEQQRVALARALVMDPALILADEPTGNLDSETSDAIHKLFFDLNHKLGTTFLIVTHSRDLAERMPRVVSMKDGTVLRDERRPVDAYRDGDRRQAAVDEEFWQDKPLFTGDEPSEGSEATPSREHPADDSGDSSNDKVSSDRVPDDAAGPTS